jgi:outer membrane lipoprotein carrier protein
MEKAMIGKIWIWIGILAIAWPAAGWGQTLPLDEVLGKIQEQYEKNADFKADFGQEAVIKSLGKKQQAEGIVYFKKPGKMHWMYHKPTKQQVISDGKNLWNYQPENKQVIVTRVAQAFQSKTPSTFLAGLGNLKKDFQARFVKDPAPGSNYALELTPLETQGGVEKLFLLADPKSFHILQARIQDAMGNTTQISFSKITFNNNLADSLFTFTAPKGVEVFTMPGASPAGGSEK